ncbi:hypothetical protein IMCC26256_111831 [Actinobacteria bacterium IMCC26256]|nr:hypothetical protein IMCC26256_111831 [Actinobacteria bacterium IMCC26256]
MLRPRCTHAVPTGAGPGCWSALRPGPESGSGWCVGISYPNRHRSDVLVTGRPDLHSARFLRPRPRRCHQEPASGTISPCAENPLLPSARRSCRWSSRGDERHNSLVGRRPRARSEIERKNPLDRRTDCPGKRPSTRVRTRCGRSVATPRRSPDRHLRGQRPNCARLLRAKPQDTRSRPAASRVHGRRAASRTRSPTTMTAYPLICSSEGATQVPTCHQGGISSTQAA